MTKVDIKRLDSITKNDTTATEQINDNFKALQEAIENTLSRDGTGPNYMDADLDMNSYRIINSSDPVEDNDIVNLKYVEDRIGGAIEASNAAVSAATQAANSAQSALVSSTNAINAVRNAEEQLSNTITYVDEAKQSITDTINEALDDVKQQALDAAQESIDTAAEQATTIVIDHAENVIKPELNALATAADEDATSAAESARVARIWAEGEQSEVKPLGGELSSMGAADLAYAIANAPEDTPIDASGLFAMNVVKGEKGDKGDKGEDGKDGADGKSVFDGYATNCITEILQDIKLELNNDTLTLKAGSKVYVPNGKNTDGSNRFDVVTVANDVVKTDFGNDSGTRCLYLDINGTYLYGAENSASGTSTSSVDGMYYRTGENYVYPSNNASGTKHSFPVCKITLSSGSVTSIDQVFNGFGYIGSTVFALPGVKGLIPNGRNADGSLKNTEFVLSKVGVRSDINPNVSGFFALNGIANGFIDWGTSYELTDDNYLNTSYGNKVSNVVIGLFATDSSGKITSFAPKLPFRAVDSNEADYVVESYHDGTNWYRVYKSGWIEQGGYNNQNSNTMITINFLKPFKNTNYTFQRTLSIKGANSNALAMSAFSYDTKTNSNITMFTTGSSVQNGFDWYVCGQGA